MPAFVIDTETTGLSTDYDRIIEIAIVEWEGDYQYSTRINPEMLIPSKITEITGIGNADVADCPTFEEISGEILEALNKADAIIGQNPWFDQRMIDSEFGRLDIRLTWPTMICTKRMWDIYEPRDERHLQNAYKRFVNKDGFDGAHGALADTLAARDVLQAQLREFNLEGKDWKEIDSDQEQWFGSSHHVIWQDGLLFINFGKYKGTPCHAVDKGYWSWIVNQDFPTHIRDLADYLTSVGSISAEDLATWAYQKG